MKYINLDQLVLLSIALFIALGFQVVQAADGDETSLIRSYTGTPKTEPPTTKVNVDTKVGVIVGVKTGDTTLTGGDNTLIGGNQQQQQQAIANGGKGGAGGNVKDSGNSSNKIIYKNINLPKILETKFINGEVGPSVYDDWDGEHFTIEYDGEDYGVIFFSSDKYVKMIAALNKECGMLGSSSTQGLAYLPDFLLPQEGRILEPTQALPYAMKGNVPDGTSMLYARIITGWHKTSTNLNLGFAEFNNDSRVVSGSGGVASGDMVPYPILKIRYLRDDCSFAE